MSQQKLPNDQIKIDLRDVVVVLLYVIEVALLLPFLDAGLNALNQPSTISFISGIIWCCLLIILLASVVKFKLNDRIVDFVITAFRERRNGR